MSIRNALLASVLAGAVTLPAFASEAGYIEPVTRFGAVKAASGAVPSRTAQHGDVSADGRYVFLGSEVGWSVRAHDMLVQGGSLVHGPDCVHAAAQPDRQLSGPELKLYRETQIGG